MVKDNKRMNEMRLLIRKVEIHTGQTLWVSPNMCDEDTIISKLTDDIIEAMAKVQALKSARLMVIDYRDSHREGQ